MLCQVQEELLNPPKFSVFPMKSRRKRKTHKNKEKKAKKKKKDKKTAINYNRAVTEWLNWNFQKKKPNMQIHILYRIFFFF